MAMSRDRDLPPVPPGDDDIEIVEIVGLDDDAPPGSAADENDVEVTFEEAVAALESPRPAPLERAEPPAQERLLRLQADFENLRKRVERERDEHYRFAVAHLLVRLLPVLDSMDRALAAPRGAGGEGRLAEGIELTRRQLLDELEKEGLRRIPTVGEKFDPERHEAVATEAAEGPDADRVTAELRSGWFLHERVLRPALVRVSVPSAGDDGLAGAEETYDG